MEAWRSKKTHVEDELLYRLEVGAVVAYETERCESEEDLETQYHICEWNESVWGWTYNDLKALVSLG